MKLINLIKKPCQWFERLSGFERYVVVMLLFIWSGIGLVGYKILVFLNAILIK